MISIILKFTFRNFLRNKFYHFISISGLAIAIASLFFILIWVNFELSFDRFHPNAKRIYRFTIEVNRGDYFSHWARITEPNLLQLPDYFPEIENMIRLQHMRNARVKIDENKFFCNKFFSTDSSFFNVFGYKLIIGDPEKVLTNPKSLVISRSLAHKYFGNTNPVGKEIYTGHQFDTVQHMYTVTGIMEDFPQNSHFHIEILGSFDDPKKDVGWAYYYLLLKEKAEANKIIQNYHKFLSQFVEQEYVSEFTAYLQPIPDIHLHSDKSREIEQNEKILYVYIFGIVGLALLVIAFINYTNFQVAALNKKLSFIYLNRIVGARIPHIASFIGFENFFNQLIAIFVGILITFFGVPVFNRYFGYDLRLNDSFNWLQVLALSLIIIAIGVLVGVFPVFLLRIKEKIYALTGRVFYQSGYKLFPVGKEFSIRKSLIILQFFGSIVLIIFTIIIFQQVNYMLNSGVGGGQNNILVMKKLPRQVVDKYNIFKKELLSNPLIEEVTASMEEPSYETMDGMRFEMNGLDESLKEQILHVLPVDYNYFDFFNIPLIAGSDFQEYKRDDEQEQFIINESTVRFLGFKSPEEVIDKPFKLIFHLPGILNGGKIVGVSKDFHSYTMTKEIKPMVMFQKPIWFWCFLIKIDEKNYSDALDYVKNTWDSLYPEYPFAYNFVDDLYFNLYKREIILARVLSILSVLTIIIACLGLVGLIMYFTEMRTKEMGIRRINGATVLDIIFLYNSQFIIWIFIAFLLATPISLYLIHRWLNNFAYKVDIDWWIFIAVLLATIFIVLFTISYQSIKAAFRNPVESIRYE